MNDILQYYGIVM